MGDCVDCTLCVQVCPTGIDIREGLQYMCIGCGACVDACDQVMDKVGYPKGLIRYTSGSAITEGLTQSQARKRVLRPRVLFYIALMAVIAAGFAFSLFTRDTLKMDIIRDRGSLGREIPGDLIENVYRLQIINTDAEPLTVTLRADGLPGLEMLSASGEPTGSLDIAGGSHRLVPVLVRLPVGQASPGVHSISFIAKAQSESKQEALLVEQTSFYVPQ
jgi:cytochrome c oxidase accessory protein FixG